MNNWSKKISLQEIIYIFHTLDTPNFKNRNNTKEIELTRGLLVAILVFLFPDDKNTITTLLNNEYVISPDSDKLTKEFRSLHFRSDELNKIKEQIRFEKKIEYNKHNELTEGKSVVVRFDLSSELEICTDKILYALELVTESCLNFADEIKDNKILFEELTRCSSWFLLSCAYKGLFQNNSQRQKMLLDICEKFLEFGNTHKRFMFSLVEKNKKGSLFMPFDKNEYFINENQPLKRAVTLIGEYFNLACEKKAVTDIGEKLIIWLNKEKSIIGYYIFNCNCYDAALWKNYLDSNAINSKPALCGIIKERLLENIPFSCKQASNDYMKHFISFTKMFSRQKLSSLCHIESDENYNRNFRDLILFAVRSLKDMRNSDHLSSLVQFINTVLANDPNLIGFIEERLNINYSQEPYNRIRISTEPKENEDEKCGDAQLSKDEKDILKADIDFILENIHIEKSFLYRVCGYFQNITALTEDSDWLNLYSDLLAYILDYRSDDPELYGFILKSCNIYYRLNEALKDGCINFALTFLKEISENVTDKNYVKKAIKLAGKSNNKEYIRAIYKDVIKACDDVAVINTLIECYGVEQFVADIKEENISYNQTGTSALNLTKSFNIFINKEKNIKVINPTYVFLWDAVLRLCSPENYENLTEKSQNALELFIARHFGEDKTRFYSHIKNLGPEELNTVDFSSFIGFRKRKETIIYNVCKIHMDKPQDTDLWCLEGCGLLISQLRNDANTDRNLLSKIQREKLNARKQLFKSLVANPCLRTTMRQYCKWLMKYYQSFDTELRNIINNVLDNGEYPLWFGEKYSNSSSNDLFIKGSVWLHNIKSEAGSRVITDGDRLERIDAWLEKAFNDSDNNVIENTAYEDDRSVIILKITDNGISVIDGEKLLNTLYDFYLNKGFRFKVNVWVYCPANTSASSINSFLGAPLPEHIDKIDTVLNLLEQIKEQNNNIKALINEHDANMDKQHNEMQRYFCERLSLFVQEYKKDLEKLSEQTKVSNTQVSLVFSEITKKLNEKLKNDDSRANSVAYLKGLFGNHWKRLSEYTRTSLISGHVLFKKSKDIPDIDHSGVIISICSALENELKELLYFGLQQHMENVDIGRWPKQLRYWNRDTRITEPNNGNWLTIGAFKYYLGLDRPQNDSYTEEEHAYLNQKLTDYIRKHFNKPEFEISNLRGLCDKLDNIRTNYRNPAAHTKQMDAAKASDCINAVIGPTEASEQIGTVQGILLELMILLYE